MVFAKTKRNAKMKLSFMQLLIQLLMKQLYNMEKNKQSQ